MLPNQFPKKTLLCVTGLTPQVITETLYALCVGNNCAQDRFVPDELQVITTREGARRIRLSLLSDNGGRGHLHRLCQEYGLGHAPITFPPENIHVVQDDAGVDLDDLVTAAHNMAAANAIVHWVRTLTQDPQCALHASMAGGRKTMGFFLGYALSLFGRPQDRLSHVLVNAPFESHPEFFYPPKQPQTLTLPGRNELASTSDAQVTLAEIPFVRLRHGLDQALLSGQLPYSEVVCRAQEGLAEPSLTLDLSDRSATAQGRPLKLTPTQFCWLYWLATRAQRGMPAVAFALPDASDLLRAIAELEGHGGCQLQMEAQRALDDLARHNDGSYFERNLSRLRAALREQLGSELAARYAIRRSGKRGHARYGLTLYSTQIHLQGVA